jgi:D-proline reductase (dithiol) PrdB
MSMTDSDGVAAWREGFEEWAEYAKPMFPEGKAKEAFATYPWFTTEGEPFTRLAKPAGETRFGLITTGGYSIEGEQEPMRGYPSFDDRQPQIRRIPTDVDRSKLRINHPGYDHKYAEEDINVNLPFDRLGELVENGTIGSLARETLVLMGLQPNVAPLLEETIPEIVAAFKADDVEAALLVPS